MMQNIIHENILFSEPIDAENPTGIDIEYDARFIELQNILEGTPEQQYGDTIIEAQDPDWSLAEKLCRQLLAESKDLRLLCMYTQVQIVKQGVLGLQAGCDSIVFWLENYWDSVYPKLYDEDGDYDAHYRLNAISVLLSNSGLIKQLNKVQLSLSSNRRVTVGFREAVNLLSTNTDAEAYPGGKNQLIMDIKVASSSNHSEINAIEKIITALEKINNLYHSNLPSEVIPSFTTITDPLNIIASHIDKTITPVVDADVDEKHNQVEKSMAQSNSNEIPLAMSPTNVQIKDRGDVDLLLEKICLYFSTHEPSHPAPLFIKRAQRVLNMNFYEIIQDVSPTSFDDVESLFGKLFDEVDEDE